jgi:hypothetical protein
MVSQIKLVDEGSCPEFDRWPELKRLGIALDFRRIQRMGFFQYLKKDQEFASQLKSQMEYIIGAKMDF